MALKSVEQILKALLLTKKRYNNVMLHLYAASDIAIITKKLNHHIEQLIGEPTAFNFVRYDLRDTLLNEILDDAQNLPLGVSKRVLVLDHATFLEKGGARSVNRNITEAHLQAFDELSDDVHLFFIVRSLDLNKKHIVFNYIENKGTVSIAAEIKDDEWRSFIRAYFRKQNVTIDNDAVTLIAERISGPTNFMNEAEKLMLRTNNITKEDVLALVSPKLEDDSFALVNNLVSGRKEEALASYRDYLVQNQEPIVFIGQVARQFRLYAKVFILNESGFTNEQIADHLKVHPYRVKLAMDNIRHTTLVKIFSDLEHLANLDYKIKSGRIDRFYGFELFLLNY